MIFAKIDFINLLPFYIFIKKNISSSQIKQIINYKKSYPSAINKQFKNRFIDGAFISSIASKRCNCLDLGIVARNEVLSVLSLNGEFKKDFQSDTSNALASVLGIDGEILIGDKALYHYHNSENRDFVDLAKLWKEKYNLPFVFARLCFNNEEKYLKKLSKKFLKTNVKIPQYILKQYSKRTGLTVNQIKEYLTKISYELSDKEKKSLKKFFKLTEKKGL
ncbi:MAG: MqnA/MqnD/SBP family protein [Campylobacterota bacterium]|nr:MqnA/MqnD/SBP family protein [Campylobacterota bacterium]